ncbi:ParB/RepB/Spo0J family partition protein [Brachybacterium squillarum]|uniref:ParB/RepB/Spo0J family partition protein n=1 Tax=Brachybacterium squillarum TaxID=661979 RepID=UPI000262973C|nr:ParB/RepB/Spo0J family partition protein [Brachybacterium squillarum]
MTQKRGLGRGLGALIPGAGAAPQQAPAAPAEEAPAAAPSPAEAAPLAETAGAAEVGQAAAAASSPSEAPVPEAPVSAAPASETPSVEETPALRTRTQPTPEPEQGSAAAERPVDMFFSGEQAGSREERARAERGSARDLAGDMAKAAAERRGRGTSVRSTAKGSSASTETASAGRGASTGKKSGATGSGGKKSPGGAAASSARSSSSRSTGSATAKKKTSKTSASSASAKRGATKGGASKGGAATRSSTTSAPGTGAVSETAAQPTSPRTAAESSPVVDVEEVPLTPARAESSPVTTVEAQATAPAGTPESAPAEPVESAESSPAPAEPSEPMETTPVPASAAEAAPTTAAADEEPVVAQDLSPIGTTPAGGDLLPVPGAEFAEIPIHEIRENPRNPRTLFDEDELDELAASLRQVGVLQPVVVRSIAVTENGESFELVMGERRWRAATRAGLPSIPAIIRQTSDDDLLRDALLENLHRSQLNPLEEAAAYQQLLEDFGCTQDELGERIGRSRPQITNTLRLLRLPPLVQRRLASGALSAGHARALLSLDNPALMEELAQRIVAEGLSVRAVERLVAAGGAAQPAARTARRSTYDPHVVDLTSRLSNRLETQVRIDVGKRKGRITLEFTNLEDLERLVENIGLDPAEVLGSED